MRHDYWMVLAIAESILQLRPPLVESVLRFWIEAQKRNAIGVEFVAAGVQLECRHAIQILNHLVCPPPGSRLGPAIHIAPFARYVGIYRQLEPLDQAVGTLTLAHGRVQVSAEGTWLDTSDHRNDRGLDVHGAARDAVVGVTHVAVPCLQVKGSGALLAFLLQRFQ